MDSKHRLFAKKRFASRDTLQHCKNNNKMVKLIDAWTKGVPHEKKAHLVKKIFNKE